MSNPGSATAHSRRPRRAITLVMLVALVGASAAHGDIGIRKLTPTAAQPGEPITVVAAGYLGPRPWQPMPVVMIPAKMAPKPRPVPGGLGSPIARRGDLRPPRYRIVGVVRNWGQRDETGVNGTGALRFRLPPVRPGRYVFALFCDACRSGPGGSLIIDPRLVLAVAA
jgi:hypothetical protein